MAKQQQRSQSTRAQLLKAFRASFLKRGFEATTTAQVLADIGLSKGAMYHHFKSKTQVMEALYFEESRGAIERAVRSADAHNAPLARLEALYLAWVEAVGAPKVSAILFDIGPSVLGHKRARDIEDSLSLAHIEGLLEEAVRAGELADIDPKVTAALLNALVGEAALYRLRTGEDVSATFRPFLKATLSALSAKV